MKIDVSMQTPIRFEPDDSTALHVHTGHVNPKNPLMVVTETGPNLYLRKDSAGSHHLESDASTPYGFGRSEMTGFAFNKLGGDRNYLTTAMSSSPSLDLKLNEITNSLRISIFLKPEMYLDDAAFQDIDYADESGVFVAGVPGRFGLYQYKDRLRLRLVVDSGSDERWHEMPGGLIQDAWHLVEVQWAATQNDGVPEWYLNGRPMRHQGSSSSSSHMEKSDEPLDNTVGDSFNLAHDPDLRDDINAKLYWKGVIREVEVSSAVFGSVGDLSLDEVMMRRAMTLFGLCTPAMPTPFFQRNSVAWIRTNGEVHKLSFHHPRNTELGALVEEARTNLITLTAPPTPIDILIEDVVVDAGVNSYTDDNNDWRWETKNAPSGGCYTLDLEHWQSAEKLPMGRYTLWFEQHCSDTATPITLHVRTAETKIALQNVVAEDVHEGESFVINLPTDQYVQIQVQGDGELTHVQLEAPAEDGPLAVGKTSHLPAWNNYLPDADDPVPATRSLETLYYTVSGADLDDDQGRLDIKITPQFTGPRAVADAAAVAGELFTMSLVRDEILSIDGSGDAAILGAEKLWQDGVTRSFHVEWQPGTRLITEDTMGLLTAADYSGTWRTDDLPVRGDVSSHSMSLYIGGGPLADGTDERVRANAYIKHLRVDDWVPRYHADLHRFMYRQFGQGGFSEDEGSYFRKWRRTEGDAIALMARLGDRLQDEVFADSTDLMLREWEQSLGVPSFWGLSEDERREVVANLFKTIGAHDAEIEEQINYHTRKMNYFCAVIERHMDDTCWDTLNPSAVDDVWEMYEYYVRIPEAFYNETYLDLVRWLLERQEPAHTVGWPIVETVFDTCSELYGNLDAGSGAGPEDFDDAGERTERDCVGLDSYSGQFPKGMWMPTNEDKTGRDDEWHSALPDLPEPTILFPCYESSDYLIDRASDSDNPAKIIQLSEEDGSGGGNVRYSVPSAGLLASDKESDKANSNVAMNLKRGVELVASDQHFDDNSSAHAEVTKFNLGSGISASFMHLFRVSSLPASYGVLWRAKEGGGPSSYEVGITSTGDIKTTTTGPGATNETFALGAKPGQWICLVIAMDREAVDIDDSDRVMRLYSNSGPLEPAGSGMSLADWTMSTGTTTFSLGDETGSESALAHHAYFAAWIDVEPDFFMENIADKFFQALDAPSTLTRSDDDFDDLNDEVVVWPVGQVGDDGEGCCAYSNDQFPFAIMGQRYDADGNIMDSRGIGVSRALTNQAPYSDTFTGWTPAHTGTYVLGPQGLTNAVEVTGLTAGTKFESPAGSAIGVTAGDLIGVSCWARLASDSAPAELTCTNASLFDAVHVPNDFTLNDKWQRLSTVFQATSTGTIQVGIKHASGTGAGDLRVFGFQAVLGPVLGPYVPNPTDDTGTTSAGTVIKLDTDEFDGLNRRGFVSFRIKFEELVQELGDNELSLLDAYEEIDEGVFNRATLQITDTELLFRLRFLKRNTTDDWWDDQVTFVHSGAECDADAEWSDPEIEHQIAVAWDVTRPVAGTLHHLALWVDGKLVAGDSAYPDLDELPEDPIDQLLTLSNLCVGCSVYDCDEDAALVKESEEPDLINPCAVIRELEVYSRHHPGIHTPTRLQMREAMAEAIVAE